MLTSIRHTTLPVFLAISLLASCAPYSANTVGIRNSLSTGDHAAALDAVKRAAHGPSKLLYFMESGLIAHYAGDYAHSNILLDRAERISDELFTRSLSREIAALITSDESRHYRGQPHELVFIHYYQALNYWYLNLPEDALVECRKANLKLAQYTKHSKTDPTYKNDAFIHYLTALFYEAEQEYNDAYISLKDAESAYQSYQDAFGLRAPAALEQDLARVEYELGYASTQTALPSEILTPGSGELVVFAELGFIPWMTQEEISLPIFDSDLRRVRSGKTDRISRQIRRRHNRHAYHTNVDYWLRVALPLLEAPSSNPTTLRIIAGDRETVPALAQDLSGIARLSLEERSGTIFVRTVARALVKLAASKGAEKKSEWLGFLVNLVTASTEIADTRSWVTLPSEIHIGRLSLPAGTHIIKFQSTDGFGDVIRETSREVIIRPGRRTFINHRQYG